MNISKFQLFIVSVSILFIILIAYYYYQTIVLQRVHIAGQDRFGIKEIYPTKNGGREWYINMNNPLDDKTFSISSHIPISRNHVDGKSWSINNSEVRMNVNTPINEPPWKNIEMTGYIKVISIFNASNGNEESTGSSGRYLSPSIDWRVRGGIHSINAPCDGTALYGGLNIMNGIASWKKEIWHTGGYTDAKDKIQSTEKPILERWIGWKIVIYNINNNKSVKMESYIDDDDDNSWKKVTDLTDSGGWYAISADNIFYSAHCGKPKDYVITNGGPIATFRSDNIAYDFKNFSVREIQAPQA